MAALPPFQHAYDIPYPRQLANMTKQELFALLPRAGITVPESSTKQVLIAHLSQKRDELQQAERQKAQGQAQAALDLHRQTRCYAPRRQEGVDKMLEALDYPLTYLDEYGGPQQIRKPLIGQEDIPLENGNVFPTDVTDYLWIHEGVNDEEPWKAVGVLASGAHFFYKAECDYTGFDCQGGMELYVTKDLPTLLCYAMGIGDYDQWMAETAAVTP